MCATDGAEGGGLKGTLGAVVPQTLPNSLPRMSNQSQKISSKMRTGDPGFWVLSQGVDSLAIDATCQHPGTRIDRRNTLTVPQE
mmetsp:Transcript_136949/g.238044  ORF Transcript_136949/g.238044 Transcript_136949/m.238044 type:complete len:84 (+) Transcript_136949:191-442(+)